MATAYDQHDNAREALLSSKQGGAAVRGHGRVRCAGRALCIVYMWAFHILKGALYKGFLYTRPY